MNTLRLTACTALAMLAVAALLLSGIAWDMHSLLGREILLDEAPAINLLIATVLIFGGISLALRQKKAV